MEAEVGMLIVETIAKIRRAFFVQGKPIKAICRELSVSRKVVRQVIHSEATEFRYEREAQPLPKIGPWRDQLDQLLLTNEGKASRERLTLRTGLGRWGNGDIQVGFKSIDELPYIMGLVRQSYERQIGDGGPT
jgi:hypothetical protein